MMRSSLLLLGALLTVSTSGCGGEARASVEDAPAPLDVEIGKAEPLGVKKTVQLTGALRGDVEADLAANVNGRVISVKVSPGDRVKKGDILVTVDTSLANLVASEAGTQVELAKSRVSAAERECERGKSLATAGAISKAELDRLQDQCRTSSLDLRAASARASQASKNVSDGTVRAAVDGVILDRFVEAGEYVRSDSKVARIASSNALRLDVDVPEIHVAAAGRGAPLLVRVTAYPGRTWTTEIDRPGVSVRSASRDARAEAPLTNEDGALLPGMFAMVDLTIGEETLPTLPTSAIVEKEGKARVFVVTGGKANERIVVLGPPISADRVSIRRGLTATDEVVLAPPADLANGRGVE